MPQSAVTVSTTVVTVLVSTVVVVNEVDVSVLGLHVVVDMVVIYVTEVRDSVLVWTTGPGVCVKVTVAMALNVVEICIGSGVLVSVRTVITVLVLVVVKIGRVTVSVEVVRSVARGYEVTVKVVVVVGMGQTCVGPKRYVHEADVATVLLHKARAIGTISNHFTATKE